MLRPPGERRCTPGDLSAAILRRFSGSFAGAMSVHARQGKRAGRPCAVALKEWKVLVAFAGLGGCGGVECLSEGGRAGGVAGCASSGWL